MTGPLAEVAAVFFRLGCTSFGGPLAHIGALRRVVVTERRWLEDAHFADLLALCQFLPGPASSQLVFALGRRRAGLPGALLASTLFTLPSAALMVAVAYGVETAGPRLPAGALRGLQGAAAAVIAQALFGMARAFWTSGRAAAIGVGVLATLSVARGGGAQVLALVGAAALGRALLPGAPPTRPSPAISQAPRIPRRSLLLAGVYLALLGALPALAAATGLPACKAASTFYRAGALVFGGGHVVLPLLEAPLVGGGALSEERFLAGYGAVQAAPGPLFTVATYLGACLFPGARLAGAALATFAIFLPGVLLVAAALPLWERLRGDLRARGALAGTNAAVVGVLGATFLTAVLPGACATAADALLALTALALGTVGRVPPWAVVTGAAAAGALLG